MPDKAQKLPEGVAESETRRFDVDKAMNTKGFGEFLAAYPDAQDFDMENEEELSARFENFEKTNLAKNEMKKLYSEHLQKEMGLKLDSKDLSSLDRHLEARAIENPAEIVRLREKLRTFAELPDQIRKMERNLSDLGKTEILAEKLEYLEKEESNLETAKEHLGFLGKAKLNYQTLAFYAKAIPGIGKLVPGAKYSEAGDIAEQFDALSAVKEKYGKVGKKEAGAALAATREQIASVETMLVQRQELQQLKSLAEQSFGKLRKDLIGGMSDVAGLTDAIQSKAADQLNEMVTKGSIKKLDEAQKQFEMLKTAAQKTETGIDPLAGVDEAAFQEYVDRAMGQAASDEIMRIVRRAPMGSNALARLEKALTPFLEREKFGSSEGETVRNIISNILEDVALNLGDSTEAKAKKFMISRIRVKLWDTWNAKPL